MQLMKSRRKDGRTLWRNSLSNKLKAENVYLFYINQLQCDRIKSIRAQKGAI